MLYRPQPLDREGPVMQITHSTASNVTPDVNFHCCINEVCVGTFYYILLNAFRKYELDGI